MKWAFDLLGIPPECDATGIKRAYARLLRSTRPDEDAEAFQRLHTAYQLALAHVNARQAHADASTGRPPAPAAATSPGRRTAAVGAMAEPADANDAMPAAVIATQAMPAVNPLELANTIIDHAVQTREADVLGWWLSTRPEFWSLGIKQQTGQLVLQQLFHTPRPMASECLDALLQFFDLQHVLSGVDPLALARLRQRQAALWYLLPENHRELAAQLHIPTQQAPDVRQVRSCLHALRASAGWPPLLWAAIRQGRIAMLARFLHGLCGDQLDDLPPGIDRRQAMRCHAAARPGWMSWPRFVVGSARATFLALALMAGTAIVCALFSLTQGLQPNAYAMLGISGSIAAAVLALWLVYAAWMWLDGWQGLPETAVGNVWLRAGLIPVLCAASVVLDYVAHATLWAVLVIVPTLVLAFRRYRHRSAPRPVRNARSGAALPGLAFLCLALTRAASGIRFEFLDRVPVLAIVAVSTLGIWLADMWRHRRHIRLRAAA